MTNFILSKLPSRENVKILLKLSFFSILPQRMLQKIKLILNIKKIHAYSFKFFPFFLKVSDFPTNFKWYIYIWWLFGIVFYFLFAKRLFEIVLILSIRAMFSNKQRCSSTCEVKRGQMERSPQIKGSQPHQIILARNLTTLKLMASLTIDFLEI